MSIRKVNLFSGPLISLNARGRRLKAIKYYSILISLILFSIIFALYLYRAKIIGDITLVQQDEDAIETMINKEASRQKDLGSILSRIRKIQSVSKNDVNFASRSASLNEIVSTLSKKPQIEEINLINPKDFKLKLSFEAQNDLLDFIKTSESSNFASKLRTFSIGSFKISMASSGGSLTTLDFSGSFL